MRKYSWQNQKFKSQIKSVQMNPDMDEMNNISSKKRAEELYRSGNFNFQGGVRMGEEVFLAKSRIILGTKGQDNPI